MELLQETLAEIKKLDQSMMNAAKQKLDCLSKPQGSLGKLEKIAIKLAGMTSKITPQVDHKAHILMAADHGVTTEGVSAYSQEITTGIVYNFLDGGCAINVLTKQLEAHFTVVDIGIANEIDLSLVDDLEVDQLIVKKVRKGTDNLAKGPAMSYSEAISSIEVGIEIVNNLINNGANLIGTGEMGIGNTTSSSAIIATITDLEVAEVVGYGSGIDEQGLKIKKETISQALKINQPNKDDGIDILAKVGGLEIGGMVGLMLGAAAKGVPIMVDGLISGAAALIAYQLEPKVKNYLIASHSSVEPAHIKALKLLDLEPMLDLDMRLGKGTGSVLGMYLVEAATKIINEMSTLESVKRRFL